MLAQRCGTLLPYSATLPFLLSWPLEPFLVAPSLATACSLYCVSALPFCVLPPPFLLACLLARCSTYPLQITLTRGQGLPELVGFCCIVHDQGVHVPAAPELELCLVDAAGQAGLCVLAGLLRDLDACGCIAHTCKYIVRVLFASLRTLCVLPASVLEELLDVADFARLPEPDGRLSRRFRMRYDSVYVPF